MKKLITILLALMLIFSISACGAKDMVQDAVKDALSGSESGTVGEATTDNGGSGNDNSGIGNSGGDSSGDDSSDDDNSDGSGTTDTTGSGWTLRIDEATVLDVMGLAVVNYDLDLTATHQGPDMFGVYTGELAMEYSADLGGLQEMMQMAGVAMDYETDGWFKNTDFRMELLPYADENEALFVDSLKDPTVSDEERDLVSSMMGDMFAGVGSGDKDFETAGKPAGLWYDWAFHMTEGDMSAYVNMNSAMFNASASQDATAQTAEGYADAIFAGSFHESLSYENESPFPYQIEVYESGEAVLTLRNPTESPVVVKFYGTLTQN